VSQPSTYVIDTSALIDLEYLYRKATFPSLWEKLLKLAKDELLICPREVKRELEQKSDHLAKCIKQSNAVVSLEVSNQIVGLTKDIDLKYPMLKIGERRSTPNPLSADPWVIALAKWRNAKVVCSEKAKPSSQNVCKIPDACRRENLACLTLQDFFEDIGISL